MQDLSTLGPFFSGSRIGVLLVHGLAGTPAELKGVAKGLNRYGFTVLCPLLAGHCGSEADLTATTWTDWTQSVHHALERLCEQTDAVFVGGLSAGAVLSLHAAQNTTNIRGLGLYSITLRWDGWSIPKLSFLLPLIMRLPYFGKRYHFEESFPYGIMNERLRQRVLTGMHSGDSSAAGLFATPGTALRELWRLVDEVKQHLPRVDVPTVLIHARNDDTASMRNALYVQKRLSGPARLLLLDNSYHIITVDQERQKVCDATARFFFDQLTDTEKAELMRSALVPIPEEPAWEAAPCRPTTGLVRWIFS